MNIITWNANRVNRWALLWGDALVTALNWDVICLQEAGNPDPAWGAAQSDTGPSHPNAPESVRLRRYSYTPPMFPGPLCVMHAEWSGRQKNHLVMVTQGVASRPYELGGDQGIRPVLGVKARLTWPVTGATEDILIACTHVVASSKADWEMYDVAQKLRLNAPILNCTGWVVGGDLNCEPAKQRYLDTPSITGQWPGFPTHTSGNVFDYLIAEPNHLFDCTNHNWVQGAAASDHFLVSYTQVGGPAIQIL